MKLKRGDRVAVYDVDGRKTGTINQIYKSGVLEIICGDITGAYHPKQCRPLKKEKIIWGVASEKISKGQLVSVNENGLVRVVVNKT